MEVALEAVLEEEEGEGGGKDLEMPGGQWTHVVTTLFNFI